MRDPFLILLEQAVCSVPLARLLRTGHQRAQIAHQDRGVWRG